MKHEADYHRVQARNNPVFLTAKTAVCLMAQAGVPDSAAIVGALGLENNEPLQSMADADTILGNALVVEAKYRTMCRLIEDSGYHVCVDLPCGYTPKALHMTEHGLRFVGMDLPIVVQEFEPILRSLAAHTECMAFHGVDATNYESLETALHDMDEPLCITTEGMMMYFSEEEVESVIANIHRLLEKHGGCWITPDPEFALQFVHSFRSVFGEGAMEKLRTAGNTAIVQSKAANLSNSFIVDPADMPRSIKKAEALLESHGLKAQKVNLADYMTELNVYSKLTAEQIRKFKEAMRLCHYWIISLADASKGKKAAAIPKQQPFEMHYAFENGIFQLSLCGRLDSISAPKLLLAWESAKTARAIDETRIDCSGLEYISSAGVRALLEMRKVCWHGLTLSGTNALVTKILQQNGL